MNELDIAIQIAKQAGTAILDIYTSPNRDPTDNEALTQADRRSNEIIISQLKLLRPYHSILSEEQKETDSQISERVKNKNVWMVDPLDGTSGFYHATHDFSVHIAYVREGIPIVAVVYQPAHDRLYVAEIGAGARLIQQGQPEKTLTVSTKPLEQAVLLLSRKDNVAHEVEEQRLHYGAATVQKKDSFGVKAGLIAEGQAEIYINDSKKAAVWDSCAPGLILKEAGGIITDFQGKQIDYTARSPFLPHGALCTTPTLYEEVLRRVQQRYSNL